ncbi:MAG: DUF3107 domain-containing protein [Angustibacter sp.]
MEVKIGVQHVAREIVLESEDTVEQVLAAVDKAMASKGVLRLTDDKGRTVVVPGISIGYVEIGAASERRVGFGSV